MIRRAVVTGALLGLVAVGMRIPLPFIDLLAYRMVIRQGGASQLSLFTLGLVPFVWGFVAVELIAQAIPALRRRRHGPFAERAPLVRAAWVVGLAFAAVQAYGIVTFLRSTPGPYGLPFADPRPSRQVAIALTLTAGSAMVAWAASVIGRRGLGNGFAVLLVGLPLTGFPGRLMAYLRELSTSQVKITPAAVLVVIAILVAFVVLYVRMLRARVGVVPAVPVPTCGIVPAYVAANLLLLPAALALWLPSLEGLAEALHRDAVRSAVNAALVLALALLASRLFCRPRAVAAAWRAVRTAPEAPQQEGTVRLALSTASTLSVFLLLAIAIAAPLVNARGGIYVAAASFVALLVITAVVLDIGADVRALRLGVELVPVYPLHRVYAVEPVLAALSAAGIVAHVRGRYFRALWHFFAPFAPVEVMAPPDRAEEAVEICARIAQAEPAPVPAPVATGAPAS